MGLFDAFKPKRGNVRFVTEAAFQDNRGRQSTMNQQTLEQLRKLSVTDDKELKLEFFFYTNSSDKARTLAEDLSVLQYQVKYGPSASDKEVYVITGWTNEIRMSAMEVDSWTE